MKRQLEVFWSVTDSGGSTSVHSASTDIVFFEPQQLLVEVGKEFSKYDFWKCPAVTDFCTNTYVIRAPFDIDMQVQQVNGTWQFRVKNLSQSMVDTFFRIRGDGTVALPPMYTMYCREPLMLEIVPVPILTAAQSNTAIVSGTFDIGKWIRPVEFSARVVDTSKPVLIRRGDPLFCVRFFPKDGETIKLVREQFTDDLRRVVVACVGTKALLPRTPLKKLYEMAAPLLEMFHKKHK